MADTDVSITFRTSQSNRDTLDEIARTMKRDRSFVLNEAIDDYLDHYRWFKQKVEKGLAAADRGELVDHEEVMAEVEGWVADSLDKAS